MRRLFDPGVLERLALITLGRAAGFSLDETALMFASDGPPRIDRDMLAAKAEELDRTIRRLSAMRDGLKHAAACPGATWIAQPSGASCGRRHRERSERDQRATAAAGLGLACSRRHLPPNVGSKIQQNG